MTSTLANEIDQLIAENSGIRLDVGCGGNKQEGFVGMDIRPLDGVDIIHDVEVYPWPLPNDCVLVAICSHLVEHINPHRFGFINFMNELWRVMKVDGEVLIICPHAHSTGFAQDPTHCNMVNEVTFAYFDPMESKTAGMLYNIYQPKPWRIKTFSFNPAGNIECVLVKRDERFRENGGNGKTDKATIER